MGLLVAYWFAFGRIAAPPALGALVAAVFSLPVIFTGWLFSWEFRSVASPGQALGANVPGAVGGGWLENFSLLPGMRALLLITIGVYCAAVIALAAVRSSSFTTLSFTTL
jgi:hypothetical protein